MSEIDYTALHNVLQYFNNSFHLPEQAGDQTILYRITIVGDVITIKGYLPVLVGQPVDSAEELKQGIFWGGFRRHIFHDITEKEFEPDKFTALLNRYRDNKYAQFFHNPDMCVFHLVLTGELAANILAG